MEARTLLAKCDLGPVVRDKLNSNSTLDSTHVNLGYGMLGLLRIAPDSDGAPKLYGVLTYTPELRSSWSFVPSDDCIRFVMMLWCVEAAGKVLKLPKTLWYALRPTVGVGGMAATDPYHGTLGSEGRARGLPPRAIFSMGGGEVGPVFNALLQGVDAAHVLTVIQDDLMGQNFENEWPIGPFQSLLAGCTSAPRPCKSLHSAVYGARAPWQHIWLLRRLGSHEKLSNFQAPHSELPRQAVDLWLERFETVWASKHSLHDLMLTANRVTLQFDAVEVSTVEALNVTGQLNNALSATLLRDHVLEDIDVMNWDAWYHSDGRLRGRKRRL
jgi:hypothetical protein